MLELNAKTWARFGDIAYQDFLRRFRLHLVEIYPEMDAPSADSWIRHTMSMCRHYNVFRERDVVRLGELAVDADGKLGDADLYPWFHLTMNVMDADRTASVNHVCDVARERGMIPVPGALR